MREMHATPISSFTDGSAAKILIDGREAEILIEGVRVTRVRMTRVRVDACIIGCGVVSEMLAEVVRDMRMTREFSGRTVEFAVEDVRRMKWIIIGGGAIRGVFT